MMKVGQKGQSLIQVTVGAGLLSVFALLFAEMTVSTKKGQNNVKLANDFDRAVRVLSMALRNPDVCTGNLNTDNLASVTFNTGAPLPIAVKQLTFPMGGAVILKKGGSPSPGLTVSAFEINQIQAVTPGTDYLANLHVEMTKKQGSFAGASTLKKDLTLHLKTSLAGTTATLVQCQAMSATLTDIQQIEQKFCQMAGGTWNGSSCNLAQLNCTTVGGNYNPQTGKCTLDNYGGIIDRLCTRGTVTNGHGYAVQIADDGSYLALGCRKAFQAGVACGPGNRGLTMEVGPYANILDQQLDCCSPNPVTVNYPNHWQSLSCSPWAGFH